ncbi:MAG: hypothetical protein ACRC0L_00800 [Angustibacter sp.]
MPEQKITTADAFLALFLLIGLVVLPLACLVLAAVKGWRCWRAFRRSRGVNTKKELAREFEALVEHESARAAWEAAGHLKRQLVELGIPPEIFVPEIVPYPNEQFLLDTHCRYARYYGTEAHYRHEGGVFFGRPAFVLAGMAATAAGNALRRRSAEKWAQPQWRDWGDIRILVTTQRIMCQTASGWLSFDYSLTEAVYPDLESWTVVCEYPNGVAPLLLSGLGVPQIAILLVYLTHHWDAQAVQRHPNFAAL